MIYLLIFLLGWISSLLWERWKYYYKIGKHLQDVRKKNK